MNENQKERFTKHVKLFFYSHYFSSVENINDCTQMYPLTDIEDKFYKYCENNGTTDSSPPSLQSKTAVRILKEIGYVELSQYKTDELKTTTHILTKKGYDFLNKSGVEL